MSDIGGQMGLCVGMSLLSIAEVFELIARLLASFLYNCLPKEKKVSVKAIGVK